ncbi:hypothetical protein V8F20_007434 [Naviculisporaceae sp. PSN 640]
MPFCFTREFGVGVGCLNGKGIFPRCHREPKRRHSLGAVLPVLTEPLDASASQRVSTTTPQQVRYLGNIPPLRFQSFLCSNQQPVQIPRTPPNLWSTWGLTTTRINSRSATHLERTTTNPNDNPTIQHLALDLQTPESFHSCRFWFFLDIDAAHEISTNTQRGAPLKAGTCKIGSGMVGGVLSTDRAPLYCYIDEDKSTGGQRSVVDNLFRHPLETHRLTLFHQRPPYYLSPTEKRSRAAINLQASVVRPSGEVRHTKIDRKILFEHPKRP